MAYANIKEYFKYGLSQKMYFKHHDWDTGNAQKLSVETITLNYTRKWAKEARVLLWRQIRAEVDD